MSDNAASAILVAVVAATIVAIYLINAWRDRGIAKWNAIEAQHAASNIKES